MLEHINWLAVLVATLSSFLIGAVWYSPLMFARPWQRALTFVVYGLIIGARPA